MTIRCTIFVGSVGGQDLTVLEPNRKSNGRIVIFAHGTGLGWNWPSDPSVNWPELRAMGNYLARLGYTVIAAPLYDVSLGLGAGSTWGNNASTTQLDSVVTWARSRVGTTKVALIGGSMGNITVLNYWRRFSTNIVGLLGVIPASVLDPFRGTTGTPGPNFAEINAAYAVASDAAWNAIKATYEPSSIAPTVTVPYSLWYNSDDPTVIPSTVTALAALVPGGKTVNMGTGGHNFNNVTGVAVNLWLETLSW